MRLALLAALVACAAPPPTPKAPIERVYRLSEPGPPELWVDGEALATYDGRRLWRAEGELRAVKKWPSLGDVLTPCIGDPLRIPPARDPGGFRKLVWGESAQWRLEFSGTNRCGLSGALRLDAAMDRIDPSGLVVAGKLWFEGGNDAARAVLRAELRAEALRQWPTLALPERILVIHKLELDPDPAAEGVLREILAPGDENAVDVQNALNRREAGVRGE